MGCFGDIFFDGVVDARDLGLAGMALVVSGVLAVGADLGMGVLAVQRREVDDVRAHGLATGAEIGNRAALALAAYIPVSVFFIKLTLSVEERTT